MNPRLPGSSYDNPIWHRGFRIWSATDTLNRHIFIWCHEEAELADLYDRRHGDAPTLQQARADIDAYCNDLIEIAAQREPGALLNLYEALGNGGLK